MSSVLDLVAKITIDTTGFDKGLDNSKGKAEGFGSAVKKGFGTLAGLATKAVAGAGAAVVAFGASSVKTGMSFDKAMSQVGATMGKTASEMEKEVGSVDLAWGTFSGNLREYAQEMGANTAFSATQAAEALNFMALAGYDTQTSMKMLPNVLNLAAAGNMDLARASDMVTDTQTAFGISLERTSQMVDEMAKAASTGNTSVEQLGDAFLVVGGLAQDLNGGFVTLADGTKKPVDGVQELEIALTAMANAGIKGSEAGTHMRNMLLKLSDPAAEGADILGQLGISAFDSEGNMRSLSDTFGDLKLALDGMTQQGKIEAISALFNTRDIASAEAILNAVESDWDGIGESILQAQEAGVLYEGKMYSMEEAQAKFGDAIYDTAKGFQIVGSAQKMADAQLDNLAGDITIFQSALEGAQIAISDGLTPALRGFVKEGSDGLINFRNAVKDGDLSGAIAGLGTTIANLSVEVVKQVPRMVEAGVQLLSGIGQGLINNAPTLLNSAGELVTYLYNGILQNAPSVISGGAQMIASVAQGITEHLPEMASKATELIITVTESLMAQLPTLAQSGAQLVSGFAQAIMTNAPKLVDAAVGMITNLGSGLASGIPQFLAQALPMVEQFTGMLRGNAGKLIDAGLGLIMNIAQGIANAIPTLVQYIPQIVINIAGIINDNAPKLLATGVKVIATLASGIISALPTIAANIPKIIQAIVSVFFAFNWLQLGGNIIRFIADGVKSLATTIPEAIKNIGQTAMDWLSAINWQTLGADIIDLIVIGVESLVSAIPTALQTIGTNAVALIKGIDWLGVGTFLVEGLISGISSLATAAVDAIKGVGQAILDGFKSLFGINSPSTVMEEQGNFLIEGLVNALTALPEAIGGILAGALDTVISWGADLVSKGVEAAQNFLGGVSEKWEALKKKTAETFENVKSKVGTTLTNAKDTAVKTVTNLKDKAVEKWNNLKDKTKETYDNIKDKITTTITNAKDTAVQKVTDLKDKAVEKWTDLVSNTKEKWENIKSDVSEKITNAKETAVSIAENLRSTVSDKWENLKTAAGNKFKDIKDHITGKMTDSESSATTSAGTLYTNVSNKFIDAATAASTNFAALQKNISDNMGAALKDAETSAGNIAKKIGDKFGEAATATSTKFKDILSSVRNKMNDAATAVSNAVQKMKNKMHFHWSLPHLKLPHIHISGKFSINPPSVPHFSIDWYKKAMDTPWLFTSPTVIPAMGFGDAGSEIVYGKDSLMRDIREAQNSGRIEELLAQILTRLNQMETTIMLDGRMVSQSVDRRLGNTVQLKQRGVI